MYTVGHCPVALKLITSTMNKSKSKRARIDHHGIPIADLSKTLANRGLIIIHHVIIVLEGGGGGGPF
jgi:hypothetical protein